MITVRNLCSVEKIALPFRPIVDDAIKAYRDILAGSVCNILLLGSVPRGEAIIGQSDIDFMGVLKCAPSGDQRARLERRAHDLHETYPVVSKVDIDYVMAGDVSEFQKFVFSSDSINLYGDDTFSRSEQEIPVDFLVGLVTPDIKALLPDYTRHVKQVDEQDKQKLFQWSRWCGKDMIKCLRGEAILREGKYDRTINGAHNQLRRCFPEHAQLIDKLLVLYETPEPDKRKILQVLNEVDETFVKKQQNQGAEPSGGTLRR